MVRRSLAVLPALLICASSYAQQGDKPAAPPPEPKVEAPKTPSALPADANAMPVDPHSYQIGPEDIIKISIWREPDLSKIAQVRPDGKITMNLVGDVQAGGLTPERLAAQLKEAYTGKLLEPVIEVEVIQINSKSFSIVGEINRSGKFPLVVQTKVFDALTQAGGFREFANEKNITILHADGTSAKFNYKAYVKGDKKARAQNVVLQNGDTIIVK